MTSPLPQIDQPLSANAARFLDELKAFLRIPSVSADSRHKADVRRAAEFVIAQMRSAGLTTELVETAGHPICYGHRLNAAGAPTVLMYRPYAVQTPQPHDKSAT